MSSRHERRKRSYESDRDRDSDSHHESKKPRTTTTKAKIIWVLRGQKEVAAFSAINNPATRIVGNLHKHKCSNCSTEYEHDHPYRKSEHPQHVKDCPKCKSFAPDDRPALDNRRSSYPRYKTDFNQKYSYKTNRRYSEPYRSRDSFRRRSRSRSPRRKYRDSSPRRPNRRRPT